MKIIFTIIVFLIVNSFILPQATATIPQLTLSSGSIDIPIQVTNFTNIGSITLKVQYDTTKLTWSGPLNWNSQISANAFAGAVNGVVSIAWASATAANISSGKLLDMRFNYNGGISAFTFLSVQCEVTDIDGNLIQVTYSNGSVSPLTQQPTITVSPTALSFGNQLINTNSTPQSYTLTGSNLTANVTVTAPTGYQVSTSSGGAYSTTLTVSQSGGNVNQAIYVRFSPTAQQAYNGNITNASTGATTQNVSVSGAGVTSGLTVSPATLAFGDQIVNTNSTPQSYTLTGSNLSANVTVTAPTGFQLSTSSGGTYGTTLTVTQSGGTVNQTIYVRFSPTAQQGYNGNVSNASTGATTQNVSVSGTGIPQSTPAISVNPSALNFGNVTVNTNSIPQTYTVSGSYLTTSIIIAAPSGFLLSFSSTGVYVNSLTLLQSSGNVPPTLIYVRFSPTLVQQYVGNISHSSTGAFSQTVSVSGNSVSVTLPTIQISSPNGGEEWPVGSSQNISWTSNQVNTVKIEYSTNNGSNWLFISNSVPAELSKGDKVQIESNKLSEQYDNQKSFHKESNNFTSSFLWIVPNTISNQCKIRITDAANAGVGDTSNTFSITLSSAWDIKINWNLQTLTGTLGYAGVVYIPTIQQFWVSRWNSNKIIVISKTGELIDSFTTSFTGTRGMAFDGQYVYHSINTGILQKVDPVLRTLVGTVNLPTGVTARFITYDPTADGGTGGFWVGNWNAGALKYYLVSKTGVQLRVINNSTITGTYGIAYDNWSSGGPFLWVWSQGDGAPNPQYLIQLNYVTGLPTGVRHDVRSDIGVGQPSDGGIAGGLFITNQLIPGICILGGVLQGVPDRLFGYKLEQPPSITVTSPNGGELWQIDRAYNITWESNSVANVKIEYTTNNGGNWIYIANSVSHLKGDVEGHFQESSRFVVRNEKLNSSYSWIVPNTVSNQCRIRITDVNNSSITDISDNLFSIVLNYGVKYEENFNSGNNTPDGITSRGWLFANVDGGGITTCFTGNPTVFTAFEGPDSGYIGQNYQSANGFYINQWLMSPVVNVNAGDTLSFWWRRTSSIWDDSVIVHLSPSAGTIPASYTVVLKEKTKVPDAWANVRVQFPSAGSVRFAFQYLIYDGGEFGNQSDYWGLDLVQVMQGPSTPPITPGNLTATTLDSARITLAWNDNSSNETGYKIERRTNNLGWALLVTTGPNVNTYHDMGLTPLTTYYYRIYAFNSGGVSGYSNEASAITSIKDLNLISGTPESYSLFQNYPNPFNPTSTIRFGLVEQSIVSLKIYNITGQEVLSLLFDEVLRPGYYDYSMNAENLPSGVYLYSFIALSTQSDKVFRATKKIILLK